MSDPLVAIAAAALLCLLGVALYGLLTARNLVKVVVALQLLGKAAILALVLGGRMSGRVNLGQSLALTVIVADTVAAVICLSLAAQMHRLLGTLDTRALSRLRG